MYATYDFYVGTFLGAVINEADFSRLSSRASDFIDYFTEGKAAKVSEDDTATILALAKACCALAEQMQVDESTRAIAMKAQAAALLSNANEVKSESVGSWSRSYVTAGEYTSQSEKAYMQAQRLAYASILTVYLAKTGLLYRGGR